uniref:Endodeoxyribonuclease n=1 Tax=Firmicutes phage HS11 TaxID=3056393 RepID=A0AA50AFI9_9VIRU|nr:MAG: endodeoxyribonuclease [Firmicutes phage HS11]
MKVKFTIPGIPVPKARPRVVRGHAFTPKKTKDYEALVKDVYRLTVGEYLGDSAIVATIDLYFPIPESYSKSKKRRIAEGEIKHTKRPDVDNCAKAILDALNEVAYRDDSQIVESRITKHYAIDDETRAEVILEEVF